MSMNTNFPENNMLKFKQFMKKTQQEDIPVFCNAGGRRNQYKREHIVYGHSPLFGRAGGPPEPNEDIHENLNPRNEPKFIDTTSRTFFDPEKDNSGLGEDHNYPEHFTPDSYRGGHVRPRYTDEHAKHARALVQNTNSDYDYHNIVLPYTSNSYRLNDTLFKHHLDGTTPPQTIKANDDDDSEIDTHEFDKIISSHRLPHDMTVYTGMHFHPSEHKGRIYVNPSYMSTSLSPHVAKDFGKPFEMGYSDGDEYKEKKIKNILRLHLPKGHEHLFTDNGSIFPGQGELILPRGMRYQLGQRPTHIIRGKFDSHFGFGNTGDTEFHIYNGRILPRK